VNLKYELTDEAHPDYPELRRIRALRDIDFQRVHVGDLGGFVQSEANLSQEGDCWVDDMAIVCDDARLEEDATASKKTPQPRLVRECSITPSLTGGHTSLDTLSSRTMHEWAEV